MECLLRVFCLGSFLGRGLGYSLLFSLPIGLVFTLLSSLWNQAVNRRVAIVLMWLTTVWYMIQAVYYHIFKTFLMLDTLTMAREALEHFWREALLAIGNSLPVLILLALPLITIRTGLRWARQKLHSPIPVGALLDSQETTQPLHSSSPSGALFRRANRKLSLGLLGAAAALQLLGVLSVSYATEGVQSPSAIYHSAVDPTLTVSNFGLMTTLRLDITQTIFGVDEVSRATAGRATFTEAEPDSLSYQPNTLSSLDFAGLIANETDPDLLALHQFIDNRSPTNQNQYTGLFAGKNLIFITAEGFWRYAVHETYTPTLYKLANSGFVFRNFYTPLWWKSTTDGEYVACTSLIPTSAYRSFKASSDNSMPFCMGNMLRKEGYSTKAYHNHTYTYYNRDISHPNMGYDYYGLGHGLEVTRTWPESDLEMMEQTIPAALSGSKPFHHYYMTVSGHMNYAFSGNAMAAKHEAEVASLDMSEEAKAYLACNMELDQALAYTLTALEEAGELENTVICLSGDHYPYGMNPATWDEFYGSKMDTDFEIYHSNLILWSGDMTEPVVIDKPCESLDILPTLLNLFGLKYDSRLLAGRDILSDEPGLVIFSNKSFLTDMGRYNARTDTFTPAQGVNLPENYANDTFQQVKNLFTYSVQILETDYYRKLGL